jgi:hypothetical protein
MWWSSGVTRGPGPASAQTGIVLPVDLDPLAVGSLATPHQGQGRQDPPHQSLASPPGVAGHHAPQGKGA